MTLALEIAALWLGSLGGLVLVLWRLRERLAAFTRNIDTQQEEWDS